MSKIQNIGELHYKATIDWSFWLRIAVILLTLNLVATSILIGIHLDAVGQPSIEREGQP